MVLKNAGKKKILVWHAWTTIVLSRTKLVAEELESYRLVIFYVNYAFSIGFSNQM